LAEDGREIEFDTFDFEGHQIRAGESVYHPIERLTLHCDPGGAWRVVNHEGGLREFAAIAGRDDARAMLVCTRSRCGGFVHRHDYDERGRLVSVVDSCGRRLALGYDAHDRIEALYLPSAEGETLERVRSYHYGEEGDLVEVCDALAGRWRFAYLTHLLVRETDRRGSSFHFAYDGVGEDAWCVRTWGDDGVHDHVLAYDKRKHMTFVTNAHGHTTQYHMNVAGQVVKIVDPHGGETCFEYDPRTLARTRTSDALGRVNERRFDARGNVVQVIAPDGATSELEYDVHDRLVAARDVCGARWRWVHDERGRVVERHVEQRGVTRYGYHGAYLSSITDPDGRVTQFGYAASGMLDSMRADGQTIRWTHDARGRVLASDDAGRVRRMRYDPLGRVIAIQEPGGELRRVSYDAEGNVLVAQQGKREVHYRHGALGRVLERREADTVLRFEYDAELRLRKIINEADLVHEIELDERGLVCAETRFDGGRHELVRDRAGQIVELRRPSGNATRFRHDAAGRVIETSHADGRIEHYRYGPDGLLREAENEVVKVVLERDARGRVVREWQDELWIESDYDAIGRRIGMRSCFGALEQIERNAAGDVVAHRLRVGAAKHHEQVRPIWEATIERALGGEELERLLPGGLRSRWSRDELGRPQRRQVWSEQGLELDHRYGRDESGDLCEIADIGRGEQTRYGRDALGRLAWAQYGDGAIDLRIGDAVGNLFRRQDRDDRSYGPAGQLLLATTAEGTLRNVYDADGQLVERHGPRGAWRFAWSTSGSLIRVERPDGKIVEFEYDALGRRVRKRFAGRTTHWLWAGRVPLHEWVEDDTVLEPEPTAMPAFDELPSLDELLGQPSTRGPPRLVALPAPAGLVTWLFEPGTFVPAVKLVEDRAYSIVADRMGTPIAMFDGSGRRVWSVELDVYGSPRRVEVAEGFDRWSCPFRWQGQYEDAETELHYNRFRYYDPLAGHYLSQDPIGLLGGARLHGYVRDPLHQVDVLGLTYTGGRHHTTSLPVNDGMDSHHMPAKATYADSALSAADGPAIKMDPPDHRMTASYGASAGDPEFDIRRQSITDARAARAAGDMDRAKAIIDEAIMRDVDDVLDIARRQGDPSRYDRAILEMIDSLDDDFYDRITREKSTPPCS
jgi:RHS repeat-associated protein